jgi:hypothetical protein
MCVKFQLAGSLGFVVKSVNRQTHTHSLSIYVIFSLKQELASVLEPLDAVFHLFICNLFKDTVIHS